MGVGCELLFVIFLALELSLINLGSCSSLADFAIQKIIRFVSTSTLASLTTTPNNKFHFTLLHAKHEALAGDRPLPSKEFLAWLIGFTEGDGSFIVNNRGDLAFVITQATSDIRTLEFIK